MKTVYCVLFALCTNLAYSQLEPLIHISQNEISDIGGTAVITCTVSNTMNFPIVWIKLGFENSTETIAISHFRSWDFVTDSKFSVRHYKFLDSSKYTLEINQIQETDVGFYGCQVLNETKIASGFDELKIGQIGGTMEFTFTVSNTMILPIVWFKLGRKNLTETIAISTRNWSIVKNSRFSLRQDQLFNSSKYTLQINQIQETDVGFYGGQVLNKTIIASAYVELKISNNSGLPKIYNNSTKSIVVMEGEPASLECYARGSPNPKIYWKKENNGIANPVKLIHRGNIWTIPTINKDDRGVYSCIAENGIGNGTRHKMTLYVKFAPVITVPKYRKGQALKHDMDLECNIEAYPLPAIIWKYNGVQLSNNENYTISEIAPTNEYTTSILSIKQIKNDLYGDYNCVASNQMGGAKATINLYETAVPLTSNITRLNIK